MFELMWSWLSAFGALMLLLWAGTKAVAEARSLRAIYQQKYKALPSPEAVEDTGQEWSNERARSHMQEALAAGYSAQQVARWVDKRFVTWSRAAGESSAVYKQELSRCIEGFPDPNPKAVIPERESWCTPLMVHGYVKLMDADSVVPDHAPFEIQNAISDLETLSDLEDFEARVIWGVQPEPSREVSSQVEQCVAWLRRTADSGRGVSIQDLRKILAMYGVPLQLRSTVIDRAFGFEGRMLYNAADERAELGDEEVSHYQVMRRLAAFLVAYTPAGSRPSDAELISWLEAFRIGRAYVAETRNYMERKRRFAIEEAASVTHTLDTGGRAVAVDIEAEDPYFVRNK